MIDPDERVEVSLLIRPRRSMDELEARLAQPDPQPALTREEFAASYGADPADLATVEAFAREHGLEVVESDAARRTVRLAGRPADVSAAFGVTLHVQGGAHVPNGEPKLPPDLQAVVQGVFGLDSRPIARPR